MICALGKKHVYRSSALETAIIMLTQDDDERMSVDKTGLRQVGAIQTPYLDPLYLGFITPWPPPTVLLINE